MNRIDELSYMFRKNFPDIIRDENKVRQILSNKGNCIIERRNENRELIAVSVINQSTIIMLCVNEEYRNNGIGNKLLQESEEFIFNSGFDTVNYGEGFEYLTPGIPITEETKSFMINKDYVHSWGNDECFDMAMDLNDCNIDLNVNDEINGITYRFATIYDLGSIKKCVSDAEEKFVPYYMDEKLYDINNSQIVLVAADKDEICGTLIISKETEAKGVGSVGCTTTKTNYQHRGIATNMVKIGTKYLKDIGMQYGYLGYTYTGLDKMYGASGYCITNRYMMAVKSFVKEKKNGL